MHSASAFTFGGKNNYMFKPFLDHLTSADDLVTTYEEIRSGFIALALEKNRRATPFVEQARSLKLAAQKAKTPLDLLKIPEIRPALITATGISDKAAGHMLPEDYKEAIKGLIDNFLEPAGPSFVEELVFRFLLTRGDTLGGSMRNIGGILAQQKLTRSIIAALRLARISYRWLHNSSKNWIQQSVDDTDIELHLRGLTWTRGSLNRTMIYNLTVPIVRNNIDLCLINSDEIKLKEKSTLLNPEIYIAIGELKGGIDPAGADEHWKTARSAIERIRISFSEKGHNPYIFFVGAAIEKRMAGEIWQRLEVGELTNAANLTGADQVTSLCRWLISL